MAAPGRRPRGGHRHPPRPRRVQRRGHPPRPRRPPYGRTKGAKRVVAVDVTGLPVGALVVLASTHENRTSEVMLEHLTRQGVTDRLELVLDRGVTAAGARKLGRRQGLEVRRVGWDDEQPVFPTHPPRLARRGRPRPAGTRAPTGEVV